MHSWVVSTVGNCSYGCALLSSVAVVTSDTSWPLTSPPLFSLKSSLLFFFFFLLSLLSLLTDFLFNKYKQVFCFLRWPLCLWTWGTTRLPSSAPDSSQHLHIRYDINTRVINFRLWRRKRYIASDQWWNETKHKATHSERDCTLRVTGGENISTNNNRNLNDDDFNLQLTKGHPRSRYQSQTSYPSMSHSTTACQSPLPPAWLPGWQKEDKLSHCRRASTSLTLALSCFRFSPGFSPGFP